MQYPFTAGGATQAYPATSEAHPNGSSVVRQQQIHQQRQGPHGRWGLSPYVGRMMVGSFAGLMILEAVRETERSNNSTVGRGLFSLPLFTPSSVPIKSVGNLFVHSLELQTMGYRAHLPFKYLVVFGIMLWIFIPILMGGLQSKPLRSIKGTLQTAPSLASCIQVRRHAWLTAVRTVWVPRHNFFLEAAALLLKTFKLSVRNIVGVHAFQMVTGLTEEQEAARVQAWSVALDSQLAGGDIEINRSRLMLTLLASWTLPDTPMRLMLKAMHIRVLMLDMGCTGLGMSIMHFLATKLAGAKWREAREMNQLLIQLHKSSNPTGLEETLPDHLAALVNLGCDEVLTDQVVQRAYNLAYNLPTTKNIMAHIDGMDYVVEDNFIISPLDAVAAWWATEKLQDILASAVTGHDVDPLVRLEMLTRLRNVCPSGSAAQLRIAGAQAVWAPDGRSTYIKDFAALLGSDRHGYFVNGSNSSEDAPPPKWEPDLVLTLRCAAIIERTSKLWSDELHPSELLQWVNAILAPNSTYKMSLLSYAAIFEVMNKLFSCEEHSQTFKLSLETMASTLRVWIGGSPGDTCGLSSAARRKTTDLCLTVTKTLVGMEVDTGYGSMSDGED